MIDMPVWQLIAHERLYVDGRQVIAYQEADNGDIHLVMRPPLVEAVGELAGEHRFLNHTPSRGDICFCGWSDQNEPHAYHQAAVLISAFDIQRRETLS